MFCILVHSCASVLSSKAQGTRLIWHRLQDLCMGDCQETTYEIWIEMDRNSTHVHWVFYVCFLNIELFLVLQYWCEPQTWPELAATSLLDWSSSDAINFQYETRWNKSVSFCPPPSCEACSRAAPCRFTAINTTSWKFHTTKKNVAEAGRWINSSKHLLWITEY